MDVTQTQRDLLEERTLDRIRQRADALIRLDADHPARWPGYDAVAQAIESITSQDGVHLVSPFRADPRS